MNEIDKKYFQENFCQTDEDLIYNYAWSKYYQHFVNYYISSNQNAEKKQDELINEESKTNSEIEKLDFESIKKIAESTFESKGFLYDSRTGLYYDSQNALYYDQKKRLYFDLENGIYYHYIVNKHTNTYHLRYHSKMKKNELKILTKIIFNQMDQNETITDEQEVIKDEEMIEEENSTEEDDFQYNFIEQRSKYPPSIRAILIEYESNESQIERPVYELGSLFLIPFAGGLIGNSKSSKNYLINFEGQSDIDQVHAYVRYDSEKNTYFIRDENSMNGTFLNYERLESKKEYEIKHADKLKLGKSFCLLLHIHTGSITCINCEPGEVIHKFKLEKEKLNNQIKESLKLDEKNKEELRREATKTIKKKYGIKGEGVLPQSSDYIDRAKQRRYEFGVDTTHIEMTIENRTVEKKIDESNIGSKLLSKMGWKEGKGLGKTESGITEPIIATFKLDKSGIGAQNTNCNLELDEKQKKKIINWNKTKERFISIQQDNSKSSCSTVFNNEDDE